MPDRTGILTRLVTDVKQILAGPLVVRAKVVSDADRIGAWPEKGILDTQLGPNRNGRKW